MLSFNEPEAYKLVLGKHFISSPYWGRLPPDRRYWYQFISLFVFWG